MFPNLIEKLRRRQDMSTDEAAAVMGEIMSGRATAAQIAGFLIALSMKGERPAEVAGLAKTMRSNAVRLSKYYDGAFDTCGTGGDGSSTFNVSSLAALVLSACGVRVAKHGNRAVSSKCGSADIFSALGVTVDVQPEVAERCLSECGIAFLFAPRFHPSMRHAAAARRDLGLRTAFNLLGPLTNPAGVKRQLVGVSRSEHTDLIARVLGQLDAERAWVVHGADGLDEISTTGYTKISEYRNGVVRTFYLHPRDFGLPLVDGAALRADSLEQNVGIARAVLAGKGGPPRDMVLANVAAGLVVMGRVGNLLDGMAMAAEAIDDGRAREALKKLASVSGLGARGDK